MIQSVEYRNIAKAFHKIFQLDIRDFFDTELSTDDAVMFDYNKFEHKMFEMYCLADDGTSLHDIVKEHYGEPGVELIERII